ARASGGERRGRSRLRPAAAAARAHLLLPAVRARRGPRRAAALARAVRRFRPGQPGVGEAPPRGRRALPALPAPQRGPRPAVDSRGNRVPEAARLLVLGREPRLDQDLGVQRAVHRTLVRDLEEPGALLGIEIAFERDRAVEAVDLSFAGLAFGAVGGVDL